MPSLRLLPVTGSTGCPSSGYRNLAQPFTGALVHQTSGFPELRAVGIDEERSAYRLPPTYTRSSPATETPFTGGTSPRLPEIVGFEGSNPRVHQMLASGHRKEANIHLNLPLFSISLAITPAAPFLLTPATGKPGHRFHPSPQSRFSHAQDIP
jgi:hypothetical protein